MMGRRKNLNDKFGFVEIVSELLKNIAVVGAGQGAPQGKENYCDEGTPFIKAGNLQELIEGKNINFIQKVSEEVVRKYKLKKYPKGTILFAKSGMSCMKGYIYVLPQEACVVSHLACITPKLELSDYLRYYFLFNKPNTLVKDVSYPSISLQDIGELKINIKTELERNKIVGTLKCIETNISIRKCELQKYDNLIKARFIEMFGDPQINQFNWKKVNISKIIKGKVSNGYFAKRDEYCEDGNVKVLGVANIVNRMYSNVKELPRTNVNQKDISKFKVQYGDMLFCRSSLVAEGIGKASIIPKDVADNILFECHVIRLPLDLDQCVPEFMQVLSTTDYFRNQVIAQSKTATMTTIGQDGILKTNIILPPIYKQKEFELFVQQVDKSRFDIKKSITELEREVVYD